MPRRLLILLVVAVLPACGKPQAVSLLGHKLYPPAMDSQTRSQREEALAEARTRYDEDPLSTANIVWLGRRLAYLGRYDEAIDVYSEGLELDPGSYELLRHRGHRYITTRRLFEAASDLGRAAALMQGTLDEVEPDGLPNDRNVPTSTLHTNIYYHLGLVHYLRDEFDMAATDYARCFEAATNDDMRCAAAYWMYLALRRQGRNDEALEVLERVSADMDLVENFAYQELLLMYKGERTPEEVLESDAAPGPVGGSVDDATRGYGVGAWYLVEGERKKAVKSFKRVVGGKAWPAFGHIAAEAELARDRY